MNIYKMNFCEINCNYVLFFAKQVREKLYIDSDRIGMHTINRDAVYKLINNINNKSCLSEEEKEISVDFVNRVIEKTRYIDFFKYMTTLKNIAIEIKSILETTEYNTVIFEANDTYDKSNTWVLLLFLLELETFLEEKPYILEKILVVNKYKKDFNVKWGKTLWFYFDDMSYSGRQIASNIRNNNHDLLELFIVPIYVTQIAKDKITETNRKATFLKSTQIINNIHEDFYSDEKYKNIFKKICQTPKENEIYNNFGCYESLSLVYFDHKIADYLSTLISIIGFGIYPVNTSDSTCIPECEINNLINGCDNTYTVDCKKFYSNCSNTNLECPMTWYKQYDFYHDFPYFRILQENLLNFDTMSLVEIITIIDKIDRAIYEVNEENTNPKTGYQLEEFSNNLAILLAKDMEIQLLSIDFDIIKEKVKLNIEKMKYLKYKKKYLQLKKNLKCI